MSECIRVITCVSCKSENVSGNWSESSWYGYCMTCATRFWHYREPKLLS